MDLIMNFIRVNISKQKVRVVKSTNPEFPWNVEILQFVGVDNSEHVSILACKTREQAELIKIALITTK
jgi:hypothetical protein